MNQKEASFLECKNILQNRESKSRKTAFHFACEEGDLDIFSLLDPSSTFSEDSILEWKDYEQKTALHLSCFYGHVECVQKLIQFGVSIDTCDSNGDTSLHLAAEKGHLNI
eukprot:Sdes_comp22309_c0_seq1m20785